MTLRSCALIATALAATLTAHCSGCSGPSGSDASLDSGDASDALVSDARRTDAGRADVADAAPPVMCSAVSDTPERWQRLPFACDCDARIANEPQFAAPPLRWTACAGRADCLDLVVDWVSPENSTDLFRLVGHRIDRELWVMYRRSDRGPRDRIIVSTLTGPPVVAWDVASGYGDSRGCNATWLQGPELGLSLWWSPDDNRLYDYVSMGGPANGPDWRTPVVDFVEPLWRRALIPYLSASDRSVATSLGESLFRSNPDTRRFEVLATGTALGGDIEAVQIIGDQTWFLLTQYNPASRMFDDTSLWVVEGRQPPRRIYRPAVAGVLSYMLVGSQIVLVESRPIPGRPTEPGVDVVRVAERTTDPAAFAPRSLWTLPDDRDAHFGLSTAAGDGWFAFATRPRPGAPAGSDDALVLLRLSDGARHELGREGRPYDIAFVDRDEVAFSVRVDRVATYRRLRISALGPPLPPQL